MHHGRWFGVGIVLSALLGLSVARADEKDRWQPQPKTEIEQLRLERISLETRIRELQDQLDEARSGLVNAKMQADNFELRCKKLQDELSLIKSEKSNTNHLTADQPANASPIQIIPPATRKPASVKPAIAQGKITAIGSGGKLMQISIGGEDGVKEGQILEVFRLGSTNGAERIPPMYLGTLTLIRVDPQAALGHYRGAAGNFDRRAKIGDEVASELFVK